MLRMQMQGLLWKKGSLNTAFKPRDFVLQLDRVRYSHKGVVKGQFWVHGAEITAEEAAVGRPGFRVITRKRKWVLEAATVAERDAWVEVLSAAARGPTSQKVGENEWHGEEDESDRLTQSPPTTDLATISVAQADRIPGPFNQKIALACCGSCSLLLFLVLLYLGSPAFAPAALAVGTAAALAAALALPNLAGLVDVCRGTRLDHKIGCFGAIKLLGLAALGLLDEVTDVLAMVAYWQHGEWGFFCGSLAIFVLSSVWMSVMGFAKINIDARKFNQEELPPW